MNCLYINNWAVSLCCIRQLAIIEFISPIRSGSAGYVQKVQDMGQDKKDKMLADAKAYNQTLAKGIMPDLNLSNAEKSVIIKPFDVTGTGIDG